MITVASIFEAYLHFQPYNPHRDSETVTVYNAEGTSFLSWDKGGGFFTRDDGRGNVACFRGALIDTLGKNSRVYRDTVSMEGVRLQ